MNMETMEMNIKVNDKTRQAAVQDQRSAAFIVSTAQVIDQIRQHPEIAAALEAAGYGQDSLDTGAALCELAQERYNDRQEALTSKLALSEKLGAMDDSVRHEFMDFRIVSRALYPGTVDRKALGVWGPVPRQRQTFIANARMAYNRAQQDSFQETLSRHGYDQPMLGEMLANLAGLMDADEAQNVAITHAREATFIRNEAVRQLRKWFQRFRAIVRRALSDTPEWLSLLKI